MQDQTDRTSPDSQRISLSGYPAITDWCNALGCSEVELAEAVGVVGDSVARVREYLEKRPGTGRSPPER